MEPQQQQPANEQENNSCSSNNNRSSYVCRQTSTRWTPTSDQIRILKDLYYNHGVRSPSTEQIQRISARLRQYGKVEGKNVFYWFQNHKARERQKKRFIVESMAMQQRHAPPTVHHYGHHLAAASSSAPASWKPNPTIPGFSSPSSSCSAGNNVLGVGQTGNNAGYASLVMENSFRECSISSGGGSNVGQTMTGNFSWVENGVDPYPFLDKTRHVQFLREDYSSSVIETLPLFPMHGEDSGSLCSRNPYQDYRWFRPEDSMNGSQASLELSLNPYGYGQ